MRYKAVPVDYPGSVYTKYSFGILDTKKMIYAPSICGPDGKDYISNLEKRFNQGNYPLSSRHIYPWDFRWADVDMKSMVIYLRLGVLPCPSPLEWSIRPKEDFL